MGYSKIGGRGYESKSHPGIITLWKSIKYFKATQQVWDIMRNVTTRSPLGGTSGDRISDSIKFYP
jgi:hypothetical protein